MRGADDPKHQEGPVLEGGGLTVELVQLAAAAADAREAQLTHGIFKAGLVVDDLDRTLNALKVRGVPIGQRRHLIQFFGR